MSHSLLPFIFTCIVIELTPGPNMAFLALISASHGRRHGYAITAGIAVGLGIVGLVAAAGMATVISNSPALYQMLRIAGVLYLLWLAWQGWRDSGENSPGQVNTRTPLRSFFRHGLIVNILNPKAAVFYITILPTFINPHAHALTHALLLTFISVCIATFIHTLIVTLAGMLKPLLEDHKKARRVRRLLSALLACIALWFGWSTQV